MFERQCTLLEKEGNIENSLGQVDLRILYDDDVFGARIVAYSGKPDQLLSFQHRPSFMQIQRIGQCLKLQNFIF